jgi:hypothetical protein
MNRLRGSEIANTHLSGQPAREFASVTQKATKSFKGFGLSYFGSRTASLIGGFAFEE